MLEDKSLMLKLRLITYFPFSTVIWAAYMACFIRNFVISIRYININPGYSKCVSYRRNVKATVVMNDCVECM